MHPMIRAIFGTSIMFADDAWSISLADMAKVIAHASNTMAGPDGIPYSAYKHISFAPDILHRAMSLLALLLLKGV